MRLLSLGACSWPFRLSPKTYRANAFELIRRKNAISVAVVDAVAERSNQIGRRATASMCVGCGVVASTAIQPPAPALSQGADLA
jgi:hypothetical protein